MLIDHEVFAKHQAWLDDKPEGKRADLAGSYLKWAILRHVNLRRAILREADLRYAELISANLSEANLRDANLSEAFLGRANLWGADLRGANMNSASLTLADLQNADLTGANLQNVNMVDADLSGADFRGADLRDVVFDFAALDGCKGIEVLLMDPRGSHGYMLVKWYLNGDPWYNSGCRSFNREDALAHWGGDEYQDWGRGQMYVDAILGSDKGESNAGQIGV